ncbi:MAG: hypothetical protein MI920_25010 [Kiloniellales bacterium]|nr:hypothetical protein [Kiloniellales bacterium]
MPNNIRAGLSVVVALVAAGAFYAERQSATGGLAWLALALGLFMIGAVWLFPEGRRKGGKR